MRFIGSVCWVNRKKRQLGAAAERSVVGASVWITLDDFRHGVAYRHTRKAAATVERTESDARHRVGDCHARKTAAAGERISTDTRHRVGDCHARKTAAAGERRRTDTCHSYRNSQIAYLVSIYKQTLIFFWQTGIYRVFAPSTNVGNENDSFLNTATAVERIIPDARHRVRDSHARKPAAIGERITPDARHRVRDRHARKPAATGERRRPDARHGLAAERGGNRHGIRRLRRDGGRIVVVNLRRFAIAGDSISPSVTCIRVCPCVGTDDKDRKSEQQDKPSFSLVIQFHGRASSFYDDFDSHGKPIRP